MIQELVKVKESVKEDICHFASFKITESYLSLHLRTDHVHHLKIKILVISFLSSSVMTKSVTSKS